MNYNSNRNNRNESDVISWIITALCLWLWPPLGIVFLISKLSKKDFLKKGITKMLDKAAEKKNGGSRSQWGDFNSWSSSQNRNAGNQNTQQNGAYTNNETFSNAQNVNSQDAESQKAASQGFNTKQPEAPIWGNSAKWNEAAYRKSTEWQKAAEDKIRKEVEAHRDELRRKEAERRSESDRKRESERANRHTNQENRSNKAKSAASADVDKISKGKSALLVFGWILFAIGALQLFEPVFAFELWQIIQWGAVAAGGGAMLIAAARKTKKEKEYEKYIKIVGGKTCVEVEKIASSMGSKQKEVYKELDDMVERGYFGKAAYIDMASGMLIIDPEAAEANFKATTPPPAPAAEAPKDKYDLLLSELDHACIRVKSTEMKTKIEKIESLTEQIFAYVRETPEKESSISSFINYYLPTTLKLINSYADFETQEFQGQNIIKSRERIESACDTIIQAYERQLDNLFLIDTIDVTSDISVLENMMKRDGLSGKSDFGNINSSMPSN